jgi:hypothetical protein
MQVLQGCLEVFADVGFPLVSTAQTKNDPDDREYRDPCKDVRDSRLMSAMAAIAPSWI